MIVLERRILSIAVMAVMLASAAAVWWWRPASGNVYIDRLVAAAGPVRPIEARISGGFSWVPLQSGSPSAPPAVRAAGLLVEQADLAARTPATVHATGVAALLRADCAHAADLLEDAVTAAPEAAAVRSDLAAAYLCRGNAGDRVRALDEARRAIARDGSLREGWFNLALANEGTGLMRQAADAWTTFLSMDSSPGWTDEARRHLHSLSRQSVTTDAASYRTRLRAALDGERAGLLSLVRESPQLARQQFEDEVLPEWARAKLSGTPSDGAPAVRLSALGGALTSVTGDRLPAAVAERSAALDRVPPAARSVAAGLADFKRAQQLYLADQVSESVPVFEQALRPLTAQDHPVASWAQYYLAVDRYYRGDLPSAHAVLTRVRNGAEADGFTSLSAQCSWMIGLIDFTAGRFLDSLTAYAAAIERSRRLDDRESVAALQNLRAEALDALGEGTLAWSAREEALRWLSERGNQRRVHTILRASARAARDQGRLQASLAFRTAGLDNAREWNRDGAILEAVVGRAQILSDLGQQGAASRDVDDALARLEGIADPILKRRFAIDVYTAAGEVAAKYGSARAVTALSEAIDRLDWARAEFALARLYLLRGRARLAVGQSAAAAADFQQGVEIAERQRRATVGERLRLLAAARLWELHGELAQLELARGANDRALEMIERGRALSLVDDRPSTSPPQASAETSGARGPVPPFSLNDPSLDVLLQNSTVLYYAVLPRRVLCWMLSGRDRRMRELAISPDELRTMVRTHRRLVESMRDEDALDGLSERLYDVLLRPVLSDLPPDRQLLVVADDELHGLAFASLRDSRTRAYVLERHPIAIGPSLRVLAAAGGAAARPPAAQPRVLVVSSPANDGAASRTLPALPDAAAEAAHIAALYPRAEILTGHDATREQLLRKLQDVSVFHYAGHAVVNPMVPSLSRLIFASDSARDPVASMQPAPTASATAVPEGHRPASMDAMFSRAILTSELTVPSAAQLRVVILAACRTADGTLYRGEGTASVARPFLAAGVPVVIAGLWDVEDYASRALFERFHQQLSAGKTVAAALRDAQLSLARSADPRVNRVHHWAAFESLGVPWVRAVGGS